VTIDDGLIRDMVEKPRRKDWVAAGVSVMTQQALSLFPEGKHLDVPTVISELLMKGLPVGAFESSGYWRDVRNLDTLELVRNEHRPGSIVHGT